MPVILNDLTKAPVAKVYSAKFFDSMLTGTGKKTGLINETQNPVHIPKDRNTFEENINTYKHHYSNGQADVTFIPFYIITPDAWSMMDDFDRPDLQDMPCVAEKSIHNGNQTVKLYLSMDVHSIIIEDIIPAYKGAAHKRTVTPCYQLFCWAIVDDADPSCELVYDVHAIKNHLSAQYVKSMYTYDITCNPMRTLDHMKKILGNDLWTIDEDAIADFIGDYSLYDAICRRSEQWQTTIHELLAKFFENAHEAINGTYGRAYDRADVLNEVSRVLHRIEDYNVPLDLYRSIYKSLSASFDADDATILCKQNLNLLLSDTLNNLDRNKSQLTCLPAASAQAPVDPYFSQEQRRAITTTEPLVLVQAGAGTGKSTVVLARIKHMVDSGINPEDITVLSFTNAAADHIRDKNPNVHSMTIASMIHTIYSANFKGHELSSIETIMNSLDIYFPDDGFAYDFRRKLQGVLKNDRDSFTRMNNFIERHYDEVMNVLDTIGQTSLELEIIICYQKIETLVEPAEVQSKYLIIDEVQDNSIFEFVYTLKYVDKHKESLFMVGDCSQTLFEFRASNPKALNVLEGSGVFATYQLQTNYRSNQEILDFANVALNDIEANQYAHIQLQANSLTPVTEQSFQDKVHLHYERLDRISQFNDALHGIFATKLRDYIDEKLKAGEQVAFLSFTRQQVNLMHEIIEGMYPNAKLANLVPEKTYNSTVFSEFIKRYWSDIRFVPAKSIIVVITQEIIQRLDYLVYNKQKAQKRVQDMLNDWSQQSRATIGVWQGEVAAGHMSEDEFLANVRNNMLQFEIKRNAIRQSLVSAHNQQNKQNQDVDDADFLFSTIHSAKGLEFANTVVIYQAKNDMDEERKRMYYVAFTRAMKSEFIVAYDTVVTPKITVDYDTIVESLHNKANAAYIQQNGAVNGVTIVTAGAADADVTSAQLSADELAEQMADVMAVAGDTDTNDTADADGNVRAIDHVDDVTALMAPMPTAIVKVNPDDDKEANA